MASATMSMTLAICGSAAEMACGTLASSAFMMVRDFERGLGVEINGGGVLLFGTEAVDVVASWALYFTTETQRRGGNGPDGGLRRMQR